MTVTRTLKLISARRLVALVTSAAIAGSGGSLGMAAYASDQSTAPVKDPVVSIEKWRAAAVAGKDRNVLIGQLSAALTAQLKSLGPDRADIAAASRTLGADVDKVFEFVRDKIALEPYAGVLRGARGTLAAGAGNAVDRALLAQALLSGRQTRLVSGRLSSEQARIILSGFLSSPSVPAALAELDPSSVQADEDVARTLAPQIGLSAQLVSDLLVHARIEQSRFTQETTSRRDLEFDLLQSRLKQSAGPTSVNAGLLAKLEARLRTHCWLQVLEADGSWSHFDPSLPGAKRKVAYGAEEAVIPAMPVDWYHQLTFELKYRTDDGGKPAEEVLVTGTFRSADALFSPLEFRIEPTGLDVEEATFLSMNEASKLALLESMKRFQAVLVSGSDRTVSRPFELEPKQNQSAAGGVFGGLSGDAEPSFRDLVVFLKFAGPDRTPASFSRRVIAAADVKKAGFQPPLLKWQMLLQPQWISVDFVRRQTLSNLLSVVNAAGALGKGASTTSLSGWPNSAPIDLLQLALLRQAATAGALKSSTGLHAFVDQPLLTISSTQVVGVGKSAGTINARRSIDIVENAVRFVDRTEPSTQAFDAALRQGVADSTLESQFLARAHPTAVLTSGMTILEGARRDKRPLTAVTTPDAGTLRKVGLTADDVAWIQAHEEPGARLLVAATPQGPDAWWSVRSDGTTVLRLSGGGGQGMAGYSIMKSKIVIGSIFALEAFFAFKCGMSVGATAAQAATPSAQSITGHQMGQVLSCSLATAGTVAALAVPPLGAFGLAVLGYELVHALAGLF